MNSEKFESSSIGGLNSSVNSFISRGNYIVDGFSITNYKSSHDSQWTTFVAILIYHVKGIDDTKL